MQSGPLPSITVKPARLFGKEPDRGRSNRYAREDHDHGMPEIAQSDIDPLLTGKEDVANKTVSLSSSSTNQQYPSAKAVYDGLALKENAENKVVELSGASTDTEYPSAKVVWDELEGKQDALASGENIKTVNGNSILGSGDIVISGGDMTYSKTLSMVSLRV